MLVEFALVRCVSARLNFSVSDSLVDGVFTDHERFSGSK